jgi:hypothetical protein
MSQQIEIADLRLERSQKVLRIERALARTFIKIADQITNDKRWPDINSLKVQYWTLVYDNTRAALSVISQISTRYVNEKTKTNPYATEADIKLIKEQTDKTVDSFWRKIQLKIQKKESVDLESYVVMVATVASTSTLAISTRSKILQLQVNKPLGGASIYTSEEDYSPETEPVAIETKKPKLQWKTSHDERVCPICMDLDNQSWNFDDNTIPTPGELGPSGTHPHCRCIINLIMPEDPQYSYL